MHSDARPEISFAAVMPLLTSRFFLYDMAKLLFWTGLLTTGLLSLALLAADNGKAIPYLVVLLAVILFGFGVLFVLIAVVFFGNGWPVRYYIGPNGLGWQSLSRLGSTTNTAAIVAGVLAASPGTAGAGLLAKAQESGLVDWSEVKRIKVYPWLRVVSVMNGWRVVFRVFATPLNLAEVVGVIRQYAPQAIEYHPFRPGEGRAPVAALELLRRAALLAGVCASLWLAFDSPPVLLRIARADFAAEFERKYGEDKSPALGVMGMAEAFLRRETRPANLDAFIVRSTENRLVKASGPEWDRLFAELGRGERWYPAESAPASAIRAQIESIAKVWLVMYLPVTGGHLEIRYENRPRESKAPAAMIYPHRATAWIWALIGAAVYLLLPWGRPSRHIIVKDPVTARGIDAAGVLIGAFFFALPVYTAHSTADALGEDLGLTVFLWVVALIGLAFLLWSAAVAAFHIRIEPHQLRISRLWSGDTIPVGAIRGVQYFQAGEVVSGIEIQAAGGAGTRLDWRALPGFDALLEALESWRTAR